MNVFNRTFALENGIYARFILVRFWVSILSRTAVSHVHYDALSLFPSLCLSLSLRDRERERMQQAGCL